MTRKIALYGFAMVLIAAATLFVGWWRVDGPGAVRNSGRAVLPSHFSEMAFSLVDDTGARVGPGTLIDQPSMVSFGFTYCPDVCPTTLADISGWLEELGEDADRVNVVFVSIDPERDTPDKMAEYVAAFDPRIRGWTGPPEEIARTAKGFRVTYEKVPRDGGDYVMNHTASVFLYDAAGDFVSTIDYHEPREFALPKLRRALGLRLSKKEKEKI